MHFDLALVPVLALGSGLVLFANRIGRSKSGPSKFSKGQTVRLRRSIYVWWARVAGILILAFGVFIATNPRVRYRSEMGREENILHLLERGQVSEGKVTKSYYRLDAPEGWAVYYTFNVEDPNSTQGRQFSGNSEGPKRYYRGLAEGDVVAIVYLPDNPQINCEVRCFVNDPVNRRIFKKAGKLRLLERFKGECELEDISFNEWCEQQWEK